MTHIWGLSRIARRPGGALDQRLRPGAVEDEHQLP
jgi:hypothetical protein